MALDVATIIYNQTLTTANTEYPVTLAVGISEITMQERSNNVVRFAWVTGKVATPTAPYGTMKAASVYSQGQIPPARILYLASPTAGAIVEIVGYGYAVQT